MSVLDEFLPSPSKEKFRVTRITLQKERNVETKVYHLTGK